MTPLKREWREKSSRPIGQRDTYSTDSFLIVTNAEKMEKYYLDGLRRSLLDDRKITITFLLEKNPQHFVERVQTSPKLVSHKWIVFDRDQVQFFDKIIQSAESAEISVAWSNPCLEVWFLAYFDQQIRFGDSQMCINSFKSVFFEKTGKTYTKHDKHIYTRLHDSGDEGKAFEWARKSRERFQKETPYSQRCPSTTIDILVKEIRGLELKQKE